MQRRALPGLGRSALVSGLAAALYGLSLILLDLLIAYRFGTGPQASIYQAAGIVLTALLGVLSGGVILGTVVPAFVRHGGLGGSPAATRLISSCLGLTTTLIAALTLALVALAPLLATLVAKGFDASARAEVAVVIAIMAAILLPHALSFVLGSALMAHGRVGWVTLAPALIPLASLAAAPWWGDTNSAPIIAGAGVLGSLAMLSATVVKARGIGVRISWRDATSLELAFREIAPAYAATALAHAAMAVLLVTAQTTAGSLSLQQLSVLTYASKPVLLGLAFLTTMITNLVLPRFSALALDADRNRAGHKAMTLLAGAFFVTTSGAAVAWYLAADIVDLLYRRGAFTTSDAALVRATLRPFLVQAPFYVTGVICWRILNAYGRATPLTWASMTALVVGVGLIPLLAQSYATPGIAAGHTTAIAVWALALLVALRHTLRTPPIPEQA